MRRLLWLVTVLAVLWSGWWALAGNGLKQGVLTWLDERRAEGWQADLENVALSGFPMRVAASLSTLDLADPDSGLALNYPDLALSFPIYWPGDITVNLPVEPTQIATPTQRWTLLVDTGVANMKLHPGTALELEGLSLTSGPFLLEETGALSLLGGKALDLSLKQSNPAEVYALRFDVTGFAPGDRPRANLLLSPDWPLIFETLTAEATIAFDAPIDRLTLEDRRPQPQTIHIKRAEARWGDLQLLATGMLTRNPIGYADGELTIKAENWQKMLDLAQSSGLLPANYRPQIERVLASLASGTGSTNDLDVTLTFSDGLTRIGFFPIGQAPSMILR